MLLVVRFLMDTPVVAFLLLLGLLVTVVPLLAGLLSRRKGAHCDAVKAPLKEPPTTRFLGTQMDLAILALGLLLLLALIGWIHKTYFA